MIVLAARLPVLFPISLGRRTREQPHPYWIQLAPAWPSHKEQPLSHVRLPVSPLCPYSLNAGHTRELTLQKWQDFGDVPSVKMGYVHRIPSEPSAAPVHSVPARSSVGASLAFWACRFGGPVSRASLVTSSAECLS